MAHKYSGRGEMCVLFSSFFIKLNQEKRKQREKRRRRRRQLNAQLKRLATTIRGEIETEAMSSQTNYTANSSTTEPRSYLCSCVTRILVA